jgi:hypothetical protein
MERTYGSRCAIPTKRFTAPASTGVSPRRWPWYCRSAGDHAHYCGPSDVFSRCRVTIFRDRGLGPPCMPLCSGRGTVSDLQHQLHCCCRGQVNASGSDRSCLAGATHDHQTRRMKLPSDPQGLLFGPPAGARPARRRQPVSVSAEAIAAVTAGGIDGERIIAAAIRSARPEVRNIAVDLGTIRWTDPKTGRRVTFATPIVVRTALLALAGGAVPAPFRFILGRATRAARPVRPVVPSGPD